MVVHQCAQLVGHLVPAAKELNCRYDALQRHALELLSEHFSRYVVKIQNAVKHLEDSVAVVRYRQLIKEPHNNLFLTFL
ncbi:hypothetical protein D3C71_1900090 [compost metagenome]